MQLLTTSDKKGILSALKKNLSSNQSCMFMNKLTTKLESYDSIQLDGTCNLETFHVWQRDGLHPLKNWSYAMAA